MKNLDYQADIIVNASPIEAFKAIQQVSNWWTENLTGSSKNEGDVFSVHFGADTFVNFKVADSVPGVKVGWEVTDCHLGWLQDKKEWNGTSMRFDLWTEDKATNIRFTHFGLVPAVECFNDCQKGWDQYIKGSLFKLITEGKGQPEKKVKEKV